MRPYVIRQGDYLTKLARAMGFDADAAWAHGDNRALREKRRNHNILQPGDVLRLPDPAPATGPEVLPNAGNRYRARVPTIEIKLRLRDAGGAPMANKAYRVLGTDRPHEGTTDGDGVATFSVPVRVREVRLLMEEAGREFQLMIGDMDPVEEPSGLRKRLAHLGYLAGGDGSDADQEEAVRAALRAFQSAQQIAVTGEADQATRDALLRAHGS